ncbi:MAG TPA: imidazole glycerol phosphate synthase subunit HisH [Nitrososphaeraceae archaeon]|nr:imidazole glycerol phosphate synthase subunit HisH [Nitrososphaeraceae archaeon]
MVNVAIFDYGAGNLFSLKAALERNGAQSVIIIHDMKSLDKFDGLVLPGVGNFDPAVKSIEPYKDIFIKSIEDFMPILGICLGMEMLFNHSEEGTRDGLKILDGKVIILPKKKVKVPHMGWNNLEIIKKESKLLRGIKDGSWAYFVHSYLIAPENNSIVSATSQYGVNIPAIVEEGNLYGTQFHPEKSGKLGAIIMKNFLDVCSDPK